MYRFVGVYGKCVSLHYGMVTSCVPLIMWIGGNRHWWLVSARCKRYHNEPSWWRSFSLDLIPGGGTRVHHGRVGSAGLCDLKILHPWWRLKKGVKILQWPPNARKGGSIFYINMKSLQKKGGQKSTILKNIGVKILQVWKWGSKFYMLKNRGQNSTMLEKRGSIFYIRPQK